MRLFSLFLAVAMLSSCATLLKSSTETVSFNSNVPKTKVYLESKYMGETPLQLQLTPKENLTVEFRKDGYAPKTVLLTKGVGGGWVVLDVVMGLLPVAVDAATGKWHSFNENNLNVQMERTAASTMSPQVQTRAE